MVDRDFDDLIRKVKEKKETQKKSGGILDIFKGAGDIFKKKPVEIKPGDEVKKKIKLSLPGEAKSIGASLAIAGGIVLVLNEVPAHPLIVLGLALECIGFCYLFR